MMNAETRTRCCARSPPHDTPKVSWQALFEPIGKVPPCTVMSVDGVAVRPGSQPTSATADSESESAVNARRRISEAPRDHDRAARGCDGGADAGGCRSGR